MPLSLQTRDYLADEPLELTPEQHPDNPLRREYGWASVASGLLRILAGYLILIGGIAVGVIFFMIGMSKGDEKLAENSEVTGSIFFFVGVILAGLAMLVSYYYVLTGKWRCAINAPERNNARWLMFACMVCIFLGPVISFVAGFFGENGVDQQAQFDEEGNLQLDVSSATSVMQIVGTLVGLASGFCFVLFIRAIASCFFNKTLKGMVNTFIITFAIVIGITFQLVIVAGDSKLPFFLVTLVGLGWLACGVFYLVMIFMARLAIVQGTGSLRSPIDVS